jgi:hypothetical protein
MRLPHQLRPEAAIAARDRASILVEPTSSAPCYFGLTTFAPERLVNPPLYSTSSPHVRTQVAASLLPDFCLEKRARAKASRMPTAVK